MADVVISCSVVLPPSHADDIARVTEVLARSMAGLGLEGVSAALSIGTVEDDAVD